MAKSCNQKAKILYLERMFLNCAESKVLGMQEILAALEAKGIRA